VTRQVISALVASGVAAILASRPAWGHSFPPVRTVVAQVERCELVLLVGFKPASGAATSAIIAQATPRAAPAGEPGASSASSSTTGSLRDVMTAYAMAPFEVSLAGRHLMPTSVQAKVTIEPGGARPMVVVLVTYPLTGAGSLAIATREPRTTRFSWQDQQSTRVDLASAPAQDEWFNSVASFLLNIQPTTCAPPSTVSSPSPARSPR
jgi:hypothetical protein